MPWALSFHDTVLYKMADISWFERRIVVGRDIPEPVMDSMSVSSCSPSKVHSYQDVALTPESGYHRTPQGDLNKNSN